MGRHGVWVGQVPSALCASEQAARAAFGGFGKLKAVRLHHNQVDLAAAGFLFLEFASRRGAQRAIDAVATGSVEGAAGCRMTAERAVKRGDPAEVHDVVDADVRDVLLGRRPAGGAVSASMSASAGSGFGSQPFGDELDEDELMLQSLSQSFGSQRRTKKRREKE